MTNRILALIACAVLVQGVVAAQQARHPDLSGVWSYAIDRAPAALKKEVNGQVTLQKIDQSARHGDASKVKGVQPSEPRPTYKAQHLAKVKDLADHESRTDPVFYCGKPGLPRIGPPRKSRTARKRDDFPLRGHFRRSVPRHPDGRPPTSPVSEPVGVWRLDRQMGRRRLRRGRNRLR
jgi:hypothetical protein